MPTMKGMAGIAFGGLTDSPRSAARDFRLTEKPADFAEFLSAAGWAAGAVDLRLRRAGIMAKRILDYGRVAWLSLPDARAFSLADVLLLQQ